MKKIWMIIWVLISISITFSCEDEEKNPQFNKSDAAITVSASTNTVAASSADSLSSALKLTWTDPQYATGLSNSKFTVVLAPTDKNFASFTTKSFSGALEGTLTGKDLNNVAIKYGGVIGEAITLDLKVIASLNNNNEPKTSNTIKITVTPFSDLALLSSSDAVVTNEVDAKLKALTLYWNEPFVGYEGSRTYKFEYAASGTNFATPKSSAVTVLNKTFTNAELNNMASLEFGGKAGSITNVDFRVKATNGLGTTTYSNVRTIAITPYSSKPTPKYPVPDALYLVGDASPGGWANPVPEPSQRFSKLDDNTFGLIIQLTGGKHYLALPVNNNDWSHKYSVAIDNANPNGDAFAPEAAHDIPAPANDGLYKIVFDFVSGTYSATAVTTNPTPANLYIIGDATAGKWANPVPVPDQQFTQISNGEFEITINLTGSKQYLFIPENDNSWAHKYGGTSKTGSDLLANNDVPSSNTPSPDASGSYLINVNFISMKYTVTPSPQN